MKVRKVQENLLYDSPIEIMIREEDFNSLSLDFQRKCKIKERAGNILRVWIRSKGDLEKFEQYD